MRRERIVLTVLAVFFAAMALGCLWGVVFGPEARGTLAVIGLMAGGTAAACLMAAF